MIEGNPRLQEEAENLEKQINQLKQQLAALQATLTQARPVTSEELATLITNIAEKPPGTITRETLTQLKEINAILQRIKTYPTT
jgi:iron-sulfur cluster repair protein YtfE (RIC family)